MRDWIIPAAAIWCILAANILAIYGMFHTSMNDLPWWGIVITISVLDYVVATMVASAYNL